MRSVNFLKAKPVGKCSHCGINCWAETNNEPAIWPCGLEGCPYKRGQLIEFPRSPTGTSLAQIIYSGS